MNHGKFRGKYRNESARNPSWDYAGTGRYFITICTHGRVPYFGEIQNGVMQLSDMGMVVDQNWAEIPNHFPHVTLDAFVVMPDHFHGIIVIGERRNAVVGTPYMASLPGHELSQLIKNPHHRPQWQSGCLGAIVQQFKRACTHRIRESGHPHFRWQPRFHDRIIRNDPEFNRIRRYIIDNPKHWAKNDMW